MNLITKIFANLLLVFSFWIIVSSCIVGSNEKIQFYNKLLQKTENKDVKQLEVIDFIKITEGDYKASGSKAFKQKYKFEMYAYKNGDFVTHFEKDINGNGKKELILSCWQKTKPRELKNTVVIFEKNKNEYVYIKHFEFKRFLSIFHSKKATFENGFNVLSNWGSDQIVSIVWDGKTYKISNDDDDLI